MNAITRIDRRTLWYSKSGPQKLRALQDATECSRISRSAGEVAKMAAHNSNHRRPT